MADRTIPQGGLHTRRCALVLCLILTTLIGGCLSYPQPEHTYEFVEQYNRMTDRLEPALSLVYMPPDASLSPYRNLIIGNIAVGETWIEDPTRAQRYATYLRMLMVRELRGNERFDLITLNPGRDFTRPTMRLEGKVTVFDTGSGTQRFFSYFLFFLQKGGATDFQVEGRIYDISSGELLMEFVDRRRHLGNTPYLPNPSTFNDEFVMKHTVWETSKAIANVLTATDEIPESDQKILNEETQ